MALTSMSKDFIVKAGLVVQGTTNPVTTTTNNTGLLQVNGGAAFAKDIMAAATATIFGATNLKNVLNVSGNTTIGDNKFTVDAATGNTYIAGNTGVVGTFNSTGTLSVNIDKFTVQGSSGDTHVEGTFNVTGTSYLHSTLDVLGVTTLLDASNAGNGTGALVLQNGGAYVKQDVRIDGTTPAGSDAGALIVRAGGAYVNGDVWIDGTANGTTSTKALRVEAGGAYIKGGLYIADPAAAGTGAGALTLSAGGAYIFGDTIIDGTTAGGVGTGALTVPQGGASITGDVYADSTSTAIDAAGGTGALRVAGGVWIGDNLIVKSTAADTATNTTNAMYLAGGAWIDKTLHVVEDAIFDGNVWFNGPTTNVLSTNTVYTDNLINIHIPPGGVGDVWTGDDGKDVGFVFHYYNGGDQNAGLVLANDTHYLEFYDTGATGTNTVSNGTYGTFKTGAIKLVNTTNSINTGSGALTIEGGVGIAQDVWVGGTIHANEIIGFGTVTATVSTATNLRGGAAGQIPIQNADGSTTFIEAGTSSDQVLTWNGSTATWASAGGTSVGASTTATNLAGGAQYDIPFQSGTGLTTFDTGLFAYNNTDKSLKINSGTIWGDATNAPGNANVQVVADTGLGVELYSDAYAQLNYNNDAFIYVNSTDGAVLETNGGDYTLTLDNSGNLTLSGAVGNGYFVAPTVRANNLVDGRVVLSDANHELVDSANLTFDGTSLTIGGSGGDITMTGGNITGVNQISATELTAATITATNNLYLTSLTQNSVLFVGANGQVSQDNTNFTWDDTGNQLHADNITGSVLTATSNVYITGSGASSTNTAAAGALQVTGGVGIAGGLYVDQDAYVNADLYVQGTLYVQGNSLDGVDNITGSLGSFVDVTSTGTLTANVVNISGLTHITNVTGTLFDGTAVGALKVDGGIYGGENIVANGVVAGGDGVAPGSGTIAEGLYIHNNMQAGGTWAGVSGTSAKTIDTWDKALYTSAKYIVQIVDSGDIHTEELMVIQDGTNVYISEYGIVTNNGELGIFDGSISGSNVVITFTPTGATSMTIQTVRQSILTSTENYC